MGGGDDQAALREMIPHQGCNISWPAVSSALAGSSKSQTVRRTTSSRAIESRRRCPADRNAAGSRAA